MGAQGLTFMAMVIINSGLGIYSYMEERDNPLNVSLSIWIFSISFWYISLFLETLPISRGVLAGLFRIAGLGVSLIPAAFLNFIFTFSGRRTKPIHRIIMIVPPVIFAIILIADFTGLKLWINTLRTSIWGVGPVFVLPTFLLFLIYFIVYITYGGFELLKHLRNTLVSIKKQFEYAIVLFAIFLFIAAILLDLVLLFFNARINFPLTSLGILVVVISLTYAITQYNERRYEKRTGIKSRARIFLSFLVVISITPIMTLIGIWMLAGINDELRDFTDFSLEESKLSTQIGEDLMRLYQAERIILSPGSTAEKEALIGKLRVDKARLIETKENLKILLLIDGEKPVIEIDEKYQSWINVYDQVIELLKSGKDEEAQKLSMSEGTQSFNDLQTEINRIVLENQRALEVRKDVLLRRFSTALTFTILASALGLFFSLIVALAISTSFFKSMKHNIDSLEKREEKSDERKEEKEGSNEDGSNEHDSDDLEVKE